MKKAEISKGKIIVFCVLIVTLLCVFLYICKDSIDRYESRYEIGSEGISVTINSVVDSFTLKGVDALGNTYEIAVSKAGASFYRNGDTVTIVKHKEVNIFLAIFFYVLSIFIAIILATLMMLFISFCLWLKKEEIL